MFNMFHRIQPLIFAACLLFAFAICSPAQAAVIISSGDTYIRNSVPDTNLNSPDPYMVSNLSGTNVRMAVFSFDISAVPPGTIAAAKLQLQDVIGNATQSYQVWGLLDAHETFDETTLTWNTAGFLSGSNIDTAKAYGGAMLGNFSNVQNSVNTVFDVTSGNFLNFLNASGNNSVTFVIVDTNSGGGGSGWATKEHTTALQPTLTLTAIPEPSTLAVLCLSSCVLVFGAVDRSRRVKNKDRLVS